MPARHAMAIANMSLRFLLLMPPPYATPRAVNRYSSSLIITLSCRRLFAVVTHQHSRHYFDYDDADDADDGDRECHTYAMIFRRHFAITLSLAAADVYYCYFAMMLPPLLIC